VRGASEQAALREKGTTQHFGHNGHWQQKHGFFFRVHYGHKGDAAVKFETGEVYSLRKKQSRTLFSNHH
jgi:hypothetical protein